ncbi:hypothetical protein C3F09_06785 [candidate division GN15 bacterium]|uniref:Fibronectin type-III domain-containing protein n=1 Tax=candidate division GN15 bacterium TaxID=2072418 RepID=A0A855X6R9_9BACT|nr:MAG: hypothetical protein C3F09_06785 [candidate division GN15 bacterium]
MSRAYAYFNPVVRCGAAALVAIACVVGCAPQKPAVKPEGTQPAIIHPAVLPVDLQVESGDGKMTVRWKQQGTGVISGYNVFISREPLVAKYEEAGAVPVAPHNTTVYPGDTNPDDGVIEYDAGGLDNGVKYYVSVRIVFPDQTMSAPSNEVVAVCGPREEFTLTVRYKSDNDGYSLVAERQVRADAANNDLYFYTKDGVDYLASPDRLDGYMRKSRFSLISTGGQFNDIRQQLASGKVTIGSGADKVAITPGNWVLMTTAEKYAALIQVKGLAGKDDARRVTFWYALCPLADELIF